jgi:formate-dependent phosphoribosylglycinamide formyltransferase (GAR transformylase)
MNVIFISPGFPAEMPQFTQGLAQVGARVLGVGDGPLAGLPDDARHALSDYLQVRQLWDEDATIEEIHRWVRGRSIDRIECLWEPGVVLAARLRETLGIPGMGVQQALAFRDKELMKEKLDEAGVRTPRHARARTTEEVREAAERIGYPLIIKPIAGAGSADTYPVHDDQDLEQSLELTRHVPEVSVEEYVEGEEFTYDTVSADGDILFQNVAWYRPKPLVARLNPWVSSQAIALRDTSVPQIAVGVELGKKVLGALGFGSGFTHMEWFRKEDGEAVFGEIGARAPGARLVHAMNYSAEIDLFAGWAEAVCYGRLSQATEKRYNAALVFKRAEGEGRVQRYQGLDAILAKYGEHITAIELTPIGQPRKDWRKSTVGDGWIVARHPNLEATVEIANKLTTDLRILAG